MAVAVLAACAPAAKPRTAPLPAPPTPPALTLSPVAFTHLPGWRDDAHGQALATFRRSCARLVSRPVGELLNGAGTGGTAADWRLPCAAAGGIGDDAHAVARHFFETWFTPYLALGNGVPQGLFTGYYEAELRGSRTRRGPYQVPIYSRPGDLVSIDLGRFRQDWEGQHIAGRVVVGQLVPMESRAEIENGALAGRGLEILWVDDPIDAFFLHVQGSGRIAMEDGAIVRLGFAGRNGHPYRAIGRDLVERGIIPRDCISMQSIRAWLKAHPRQGARLMASNPSFIFFRVVEGDGPTGATGAQGVALTPGRSLAVDRRFVPLGVPVWLDTTDPVDASRPLRRLVVAQDTGGAIRGPVRGDLFWGFGAAAAERAGLMKQKGRYYLLLPKGTKP
ncbi:MAG TPA: murein transglycosylase A [Rhodospirillales bacterium]|nr:murein transglycosylase A [Rhodospirillales bacterium]